MLNDFLINLSNQYPSCNITYIEYSLSPIMFILLGFGIFIMSVICHELGHFLAFRILNKKVTIQFGYFNDKIKLMTGYEFNYVTLDKEEKIFVYGTGILLGLIPIFIATTFLHGYLLLIAPYIIGSTKDFRLIWENIKNDFY